MFELVKCLSRMDDLNIKIPGKLIVTFTADHYAGYFEIK